MQSLWTQILRWIDSRKYPVCRLCKTRRLVPDVSSEFMPETVCVFCWRHERSRVRWHNKRARNHASKKRVSTQQWVGVLHLHNYGCMVCGKGGKGNLTLDHITSLSLGGNQTITNVQPLCVRCHSLKDGWKARPYYIRFFEKLKKRLAWYSRQIKKKLVWVYSKLRFW